MTRLWKEENILFAEYAKLDATKRPRDLVEELRAEHRALLDALEKCATADPDGADGQTRFRDARNALTAHAEKEERELYSLLRQLAEKDEPLRQTLELFRRDLEDVSTEASGILDRVATGTPSAVDLAHAYGELRAILRARMKREEASLFPKVAAI